jgi:hypothetical protein
MELSPELCARIIISAAWDRVAFSLECSSFAGWGAANAMLVDFSTVKEVIM